MVWVCVSEELRSTSVFPVLLSQVFTRGELQMIADLCVKHDTLCFSDEVYEWLVYRGHQHIKIGTIAVHISGLMYFRSPVLWLQAKESLRSTWSCDPGASFNQEKYPRGQSVVRCPCLSVMTVQISYSLAN